MKNKSSIDLLHDQISSSFSQSSARRRQWFSVSESAANQNASINKNSKNSNSKNLKQHTLAKSISFCCFCFCSAREIDRFFILICKYLSHQFDKILNQNSHSRDFIYFVFALFFLFSHLSFHICRICLETFCFNDDQTDIWITINEFFRNVDR